MQHLIAAFLVSISLVATAGAQDIAAEGQVTEVRISQLPTP
jgi:hypothetical protein